MNSSILPSQNRFFSIIIAPNIELYISGSLSKFNHIGIGHIKPLPRDLSSYRFRFIDLIRLPKKILYIVDSVALMVDYLSDPLPDLILNLFDLLSQLFPKHHNIPIFNLKGVHFACYYLVRDMVCIAIVVKSNAELLRQGSLEIPCFVT
jgi:hypothetical protein